MLRAVEIGVDEEAEGAGEVKDAGVAGGVVVVLLGVVLGVEGVGFVTEWGVEDFCVFVSAVVAVLGGVGFTKLYSVDNCGTGLLI